MKATRETIPTLIQNREEFSNGSGTLKGIKDPRHISTWVESALSGLSKLDEDERARLRIDYNENGIAYLIMSYETPIAWETKNGWVYKVQQQFTQTTSKHQGLLHLFEKR